MIYVNNLPVADRERAKVLLSQYDHLTRIIGVAAIPLAVFATGAVVRTFGTPYKILAPLGFMLGYYGIKGVMRGVLNRFYEVNALYFFQKYDHLTVDRPEDVKDPRRNYFKVDTSVYYRETADEIRGHGHHGDEHHHDHDTSTYYGPYPVSFDLTLV
jgi:hypothetical protein